MAGPAPPRWSSRQAIFFIQVAYLLILGAFVVAYRVDWVEPRGDFFGPVPFLVPWFGAVGATLLSLKGVFDHRGRDWNPLYCYWHWARPIVGSIVGTISVLMFQAGILAVGGQTPNEVTTPTPKNLLYYLVAFVVGYREDVFRDLIKRFADVIFTSAPTERRADPVIEFVDPPQAQSGQVTVVAVVGRGLSGVTSARLGGNSISAHGESDTRLTVTVPADAAAGSTRIVITTSAGTTSTPFTIT
jgi:hypothetical protein